MARSKLTAAYLAFKFIKSIIELMIAVYIDNWFLISIALLFTIISAILFYKLKYVNTKIKQKLHEFKKLKKEKSK